MNVSIIIRTKNEAEFIEQTLSRVWEQDFSGNYEIIIVDSGSTDSTIDIINKHNAELIRIPKEEFSYGRSLNIGASHAKGKVIVNLSAHALPKDKKWLTNLTAGFEDPAVAAVYGRQLSIARLNPFEALLNELFFGKHKIKFTSRNNRMLRKIRFTNSNAAIRKNVWQRYKFNEQVLYGEDLVWQREVIEAGFSIVYAPDAVVYHTHKVSISSVYRNSLNCSYNWSLLEQKRQSIPFIIIDLLLFLGSIPGSILQNVAYICQNKYYRHIKVAPFWVFSALFGSLMGRIKYRAKRQLW